MNLTPRQLTLLVHIRRFRYDNGVSPTMQELADIVGRSKVTIYETLLELRRKGAIVWSRNAKRSIRVLGEDTVVSGLTSTVHEAAGALREAGRPQLADKLERLTAVLARPAKKLRSRPRARLVA